eukprot:Gregarina_sp_Poly_1__6963@NODE_378_length_9084_cov_115_952201_g311_i0_p7_GENE_NODE_378_length_9084_cov_115_952201_g311_i0NODE_378_length_9084_cov_115_952201_g311_i0_p7_ORF_typecomplete_len128_score16_01Histone/PF00125_24/2_4e12CBFD_NFYB_HMF/PF00808_23/0_016CBFD_NFYB_HMF/PF00808_23/1e02TPD/PF14811_6/0_0053_NODE_378_length_9084_cov_115_952201_g311_i059316314
MSGPTSGGGLGKGKSIKGLQTGKKSGVNKSKQSGLVFPVTRIQKQMKQYCDRVGVGGAIYLAGVLEYLVTEVLELAANYVKENKGGRIQPKHISYAIKTDEELAKVAKDVIFANGGVVASAMPEKNN